MEGKKKRRPITVLESKKRKVHKARNKILKRMNDLTKPIAPLLNNPDLHLL